LKFSLKGDLASNLSVYPTNFHAKPFNRLPIPPNFHAIPPRTSILGADATPDPNTLMSLFLVLFSLIFKASKA
jgi:hypothetical protein